MHPGGPFWAKKDLGAWSIPKGELEGDELITADEFSCAAREFSEEIGQPPPSGEPVDLGEIRQSGGKVVRAFGLRAAPDEIDAGTTRSNEIEIEWPRGTGRRIRFPEVDRAEWMSPPAAREKLVPAQVTLLDRLLEIIGER